MERGRRPVSNLRAAILVLPILLLACLGASFPVNGAELAESQVLRRGNGTEPTTLDPQKAESVTDFNILEDLFEGLIAEGPKGELLPGVAESWEKSADGMVYTFHLRPAAKWSNDEPLTAEDFVYGIRRAVDPAVGGQYGFVLYPLRNAKEITAGKAKPDTLGVEALDAHTLRLTLRAPTPYILGLLTHPATYPAYRPSIEKYGSQFTHPGHLVSDGAYRLKGWIPQSKVVLEKNPNYWNAAQVRITRVEFEPIESSNSELNRYRSGSLDMTEGVPLEQFDWVKQNLGAELHSAPYIGTSALGFNLTRPPFKGNLKLRHALSLAIDRDILVKKVTRGGEIPAYSWVPPSVAGYDPQAPGVAELSQATRVALAKKLYAEAGYGPDKPLDVEIRYNTNENNKLVVIAIAAMWKQALGVNVTLINEEFKVFLENRRLKKVTQVFREGWIGDYNDANTFLELWRSDSGLNDTGYADPHYDALVEKAGHTGDLAKRKALFENAERIMLADQPIMPLWFYVSRHLVKPYVLGYADNVEDHHPTRWLSLARH